MDFVCFLSLFFFDLLSGRLVFENGLTCYATPSCEIKIRLRTDEGESLPSRRLKPSFMFLYSSFTAHIFYTIFGSFR